MIVWALLFGGVVGLSLGLTGGGGAVFAVPLLVYGLHVAPRDAVGVSLLAVGLTALAGCAWRWWRGQVEWSTGLLLAATGMPATPLGARVAGWLPEPVLLGLLGLLMTGMAARAWWLAGAVSEANPPADEDESGGPTCRRDPEGQLRWTTPCALVLAATGAATGFLSGLLGVGGGFIIVPALVSLSGMAWHSAIGTSLLIIALVSAAGVASHAWAGSAFDLATTLPFAGGALAGMMLGAWLSTLLAGPALQRVFAAVLVFTAGWIIWNNWG